MVRGLVIMMYDVPKGDDVPEFSLLVGPPIQFGNDIHWNTPRRVPT